MRVFTVVSKFFSKLKGKIIEKWKMFSKFYFYSLLRFTYISVLPADFLTIVLTGI